MKRSLQDVLKDARAMVPEVSTDEVSGRLEQGMGETVLLDVREKEEFREGHLPDAISVPRGFLEIQIETAIPDRDTPIVAYCQGGTRSLIAGRALKEMGYTDVVSMASGRARGTRGPRTTNSHRTSCRDTAAIFCSPRSARKGRRSFSTPRFC